MPLLDHEIKGYYFQALKALRLPTDTLLQSQSPKVYTGNLAYLEMSMSGAVIWSDSAFSNRASLEDDVKNFFAGSVPKLAWNTFGIAFGMHANHTEPKLLHKAFTWLDANPRSVDHILLASELDCCPMCVAVTVRALQTISAVVQLKEPSFRFIVVEVRSKTVREGIDFFPPPN